MYFTSCSGAATITNYYFCGQKTCQRYTNPALSQLEAQLEHAKSELQKKSTHMLHLMMRQFNKDLLVWQKAVRCIAELDCLLTLAKVSDGPDMCQPTFVMVTLPTSSPQEGATQRDSLVPLSQQLSSTQVASQIPASAPTPWQSSQPSQPSSSSCSSPSSPILKLTKTYDPLLQVEDEERNFMDFSMNSDRTVVVAVVCIHSSVGCERGSVHVRVVLFILLFFLG